MFRALIIGDTGKSEGWTDATKFGATFVVDGNTVTFRKRFGRDLFREDVFGATVAFLQAYERSHGPFAVYERKNKYRFIERGRHMSDAFDLCIEVDESGDGFVTRKKLLHFSCYGKCGTAKSVFLPDLLDLCVAEGFLEIFEGHYVPTEKFEKYKEAASLKTILPRNIKEETGWTAPSDRPDKIVRV